MYSARASRDTDEEFEDSWVVRASTAPQNKPASFGPGTGIALAVLATLLVLLLPSGNGPRPLKPKSYLPSAGSLGSSMSIPTPGRGSLSIREDFNVDLRNWQGLGNLRDEWQKVGNAVRVGSLKLWKPTLTLSDYNLEFQAQIQNRAVGWAFRASDAKNYYATKISILPAGARGSLPRAEIIRYVVENGRQVARTALPIPLSAVDDNSTYEVKMGVRGSKFTTVLNGQTVDNWADTRFQRGGVGFFSDPGERATLQWVSVSEKQDVLQRFLSFAFLVHPTAWPVAAQ
ncbi:MAG: hypothetical protein R2729_22905 [Bryobacteraceae bacterium]